MARRACMQRRLGRKGRDIKRGHKIRYSFLALASLFILSGLRNCILPAIQAHSDTMKSSLLSLIALSAAGVWAHGEEGAKEMGPVAFMWPPDRKWGEKYDNNAPCGSSTGPVNRTDFPLSTFNLSKNTQCL